MSSGPPGRSLAVRGPFRGVSGHDHHTREFVRQLVSQGVRVQLTDLAEWHPVKLPPDACDPWFDQLASPVDAASTLHFCMPHQVRLSPARLRELGFRLFTLTQGGLRRYEPVGELAANVVAVRSLITLLDGLPEPDAAGMLRALAGTSPPEAGGSAG